MENSNLLFRWDGRIWHLPLDYTKALYKINRMLRIENLRNLVAYKNAKALLNGK